MFDSNNEQHGRRLSELRIREKAIAQKFIGGFPWPTALWALTNTIIWLSLWPLVISDLLPLWLGFLIATVNIVLSYPPSHDAQHDIIVPRSSKFHWFNDFIGHFSLIPLAMSFNLLRQTHLEHHRHTNNPLLDPDYHMNSHSVKSGILKAITKNQDRYDQYRPTLIRLDTLAARRALFQDSVTRAIFYLVLFMLAWISSPLTAFVIWWLPRYIAGSYINFFLSWAPHFPSPEQGRYRNTRGFKSRLGNLITFGSQYHIVHHLYPTIPLYRNPAAFRALRPILEEWGCELGGLKR
jgi:beta-carotene hydroxylase